MHAQPGFQGDSILRDDRPRVDSHHTHVQPEVGKSLLQQGGTLAQPLIVGFVRKRLRLLQQTERRQLVIGEPFFLAACFGGSISNFRIRP